MLIATDGACKRNGTPECNSIGVAWIQEDCGRLLYKAKFETHSTSQRGEINGLIEALLYAVEQSKPYEDIIIITDSEYLHNTVTFDWCFKWRDAGWKGSNGPAKNPDLWAKICKLLDALNKDGPRVFIQWTKGHLIHYTPGNIKQAMLADKTGIELYSRICAVARRPADMPRILSDFINNREAHNMHSPGPEICLEWAIANTTADSLAGFLMNLYDSQVLPHCL